MVTIDNHKINYFLNENKFYLGIDNHLLKSFDKVDMINAIDMICEGRYKDINILKNYSCYEMNLLMDIENKSIKK